MEERETEREMVEKTETVREFDTNEEGEPAGDEPEPDEDEAQ